MVGVKFARICRTIPNGSRHSSDRISGLMQQSLVLMRSALL